MEYLSIIIDRVGTTNVFNIIQGRLPTRDTHLQTVVDEDLLEEFLQEVHRLARRANSIAEGEAAGSELSRELRQAGEAFFLQFFPEQIQERLRRTDHAYLFLHVDHRLRNVPWGLLHDGNSFLADRFYLGKNVSGFWKENQRTERDRLRLLIVADPTEDLPWAAKEGEGLFETLNAEVSPDQLDLQFMSGRHITKLALLNAIKNRDIIHYAGHVHYDREEQESGWLLSGGKVLRAREIEKVGALPGLVFSNSCLSLSGGEDPTGTGGSRLNDLAGAFLRTGICNYVGTHWEIRDSSRTFDFALNFYRAIFEERSVGEALFEARQHARRSYPADDLTWAGYALHGNPLARIFRSRARRAFDASRNELNALRVTEQFPQPIAQAYLGFQEVPDDGRHQSDLFAELIATLDATLSVVGALVFGSHRHMNLRTGAPPTGGPVGAEEWVRALYVCSDAIRMVKKEIAAGRVLEYLYLHRSSIEKMLVWRAEFLAGAISDSDLDSHLVTFQYQLENLLADLSALGRYPLLYIPRSGDEVIALNGPRPRRMALMPAEFEEPELREQAEACRGQVCFHNTSRRLLIGLADFLKYDPSEDKFRLPLVAAGESAAVAGP